MFNRNHIVLGLILGFCIPVVGYALLLMLFDSLTAMGVVDEVTVSSAAQRARTLSLLGICANIIPFEYYRKKRFDNTMRGLVFPTLIYVAIWIFTYRHILFGA